MRRTGGSVALRLGLTVLGMAAMALAILVGGRAAGFPGLGGPGDEGVDVPGSGAGTFTLASGSAPRVGTGKVLRYRVEVEDGIGQDANAFAERVDRILADPRGWTAGGRWAFVRPASGPVDFVVRLASPSTVDSICATYGVDTNGEASCRGGRDVMINLKRWLLGIPAYHGDVDTYQHLVINHEVGHFLGYGHMACPGKDEWAPVMQTQMYGLHGCRPNAWPYRDGHFVSGPPDD